MDPSTESQAKNPLETLLLEQMAIDGPLPFSQFMESCLYHPQFGYYMSGQTRIGREGDFFTSSSVHALFGKLISRQLHQMWELLDRPNDFVIAEQGAGAGHLCLDILNALRDDAPEFYRSLRYSIVEISAVNRSRQAELLASHLDSVAWCQSHELAGMVGCFLTNELVDAFPVHCVEMRDGELREVFVAPSESGFGEILQSPSTQDLSAYFDWVGVDLAEGNRAEINLAAPAWLREVAGLLKRGFVLTIDYGYQACDLYAPWRTMGTLMTYHQHHSGENPYIRVGQQDLTAHVDFTALEKAGEEVGLRRLFYGDQCRFLLGLGFVDALLEAQSRESDPRRAQALRLTLKNLILPEGGMGEIFKVLVQGKGVGTPDLLCARPLRDLPFPAPGF